MSDSQVIPLPPTTAVSELDTMKQLIIAATVLNESEKHYWLDLLPNMNASQRGQLKSILTTEQKNITDIDQKYDRKLENVAQKYLSRWDSEKVRAERLKRVQEEQKTQVVAEENAEALLKGW